MTNHLDLERTEQISAIVAEANKRFPTLAALPDAALRGKPQEKPGGVGEWAGERNG